MVELFTTGPAQVVGLDRGRLAVGAPGDITVFSLEREWTFDVNQTQSKSKNSPFDQHSFRGGPIATIVAGELVWDHRQDSSSHVPALGLETAPASSSP
jgi:dihydroorotase